MGIYHPERFYMDTGDYLDWSYYQAEYIDTHVAVNGLEKI